MITTACRSVATLAAVLLVAGCPGSTFARDATRANYRPAQASPLVQLRYYPTALWRDTLERRLVEGAAYARLIDDHKVSPVFLGVRRTATNSWSVTGLVCGEYSPFESQTGYIANDRTWPGSPALAETLCRFESLTYLELFPVKADAAFLARILRSLHLRYVGMPCGFSTALLSRLPRSESIQEVNLSGAAMRECDLGHFAPRIRTLCLDGAALHPGWSSCVTNLTGLESISLERCDLDLRDIATLARLPSLRRINLRHTGLPAGAVDALMKSPTLEEISCIPDTAPIWWSLALLKEREGQRIVRIIDRFELLLPLGLSRQMEFP